MTGEDSNKGGQEGGEQEPNDLAPQPYLNAHHRLVLNEAHGDVCDGIQVIFSLAYFHFLTLWRTTESPKLIKNIRQ